MRNLLKGILALALIGTVGISATKAGSFGDIAYGSGEIIIDNTSYNDLYLSIDGGETWKKNDLDLGQFELNQQNPSKTYMLKLKNKGDSTFSQYRIYNSKYDTDAEKVNLTIKHHETSKKITELYHGKLSDFNYKSDTSIAFSNAAFLEVTFSTKEFTSSTNVDYSLYFQEEIPQPIDG